MGYKTHSKVPLLSVIKIPRTNNVLTLLSVNVKNLCNITFVSPECARWNPECRMRKMAFKQKHALLTTYQRWLEVMATSVRIFWICIHCYPQIIQPLWNGMEWNKTIAFILWVHKKYSKLIRFLINRYILKFFQLIFSFTLPEKVF